MQQQFGIESAADLTGDDVSAGGFTSNNVFLFVGRFSGNGTDANTMQASFFPTGSTVANFTDPAFQWMLTAHSAASFNPVITGLQFTSLAEGNFTVSNVWIGGLVDLAANAHVPRRLQPRRRGDSADYVAWRNAMGQTGSNLAADANGDNVVDAADWAIWRAHFGM